MTILVAVCVIITSLVFFGFRQIIRFRSFLQSGFRDLTVMKLMCDATKSVAVLEKRWSQTKHSGQERGLWLYIWNIGYFRQTSEGSRENQALYLYGWLCGPILTPFFKSNTPTLARIRNTVNYLSKLCFRISLLALKLYLDWSMAFVSLYPRLTCKG